MWRNRTVCLVGITVALEAAGCVVSEGGDHRAPTDNGYRAPDSGGSRSSGGARQAPAESTLSVEWELAYVDGAFVDCAEAGTPTVMLRAEMRGGPSFSASFPCEAHGGVLAHIPPGVYDVSLDLLDPHGRTVAGLDDPGVRVLAGAVSEPDEVAVFPVQAWDMLWTIGVAHRSGRTIPVSCADVGAVTVRFVTQLGAEAAETYDLPCTDYGAMSTAIRPGDYLVRMLLIDHVGRPIADTDFAVYEVTLDEPATIGADFAL